MFGAYAEKQGGGKSFLFGRKTWKKRWFVVDTERRIGYWESEAHQRSNSPPLKPHLGLDGSVVDVPGDAVVVGDRQVWPFTLRFAEGSGDKAELAMRTDDKPSRDKFVQALMSVGVKATGGGVPAAAPSPSAGGAGSSGSGSSGGDAGAGSVDPARSEIKSSTGRVAPVVLSVEGDGSAAGSAGGSGAAARPAASDASSAAVAPAREVAFSSGSGKTPPPPPPRLTSTSIGTPRRPGAPGSGLAGIDATLPASAGAGAPAAAEAATARTEPAPAAAGGDDADAAPAAREGASPPGVPKPAAPGGVPPPEVEAAAREAQLAIMEREEQLPAGWTIGSSADGYVFYVSPTGESQWDKPTA